MANTYDIFDIKGGAEWFPQTANMNEFVDEEGLSYDGPRQKVIQIELCLHLTVSTRS